MTNNNKYNHNNYLNHVSQAASMASGDQRARTQGGLEFRVNKQNTENGKLFLFGFSEIRCRQVR